MLSDHLQDVRVEWLWRGGAGVSFAEEYGTRYRARGHRIVILMVGGNDIDNGMSPHQLADRMGRLAYDYAHLRGGPDCVIIPSLWPRQDGHYNRQIMHFLAWEHMAISHS